MKCMTLLISLVDRRYYMSEDRKATDDLLRAMEKFITTKSVVGEQ